MLSLRTYILVVAVAALDPGSAAMAQTDYYNTDAGRPLRIEDASPTERYAFELKPAPVRLERAAPGRYTWEVEPEIAYGLFPRTQIEFGLPIAFVDAQDLPAGERLGIAGVEASVMHNLNVETRTLPALAIRADALLPVGRFAPEDAYVSLTGIATRTYRFARFHVNGRYTFGPEAEHAEDVSRWLAGVAADKAFPLRSTLLLAEVYAEQPIDSEAEPVWTAGGGVRYQVNPRVVVDGGLGRRFTGDGTAWFFTFGLAYAFAVRSLIPIPRR